MSRFSRWPTAAGGLLVISAVIARAEGTAALVGHVEFRSFDTESTRGTPDGGGQDSVLVYVDGYDAEPATPPGPTTVSQFALSFNPNLVPVVRGQEVRFQNDDAVVHNIFANDPKFDLGHYKNNWKSRRFSSPGVIQVFCNVHPQMAAWVVVLRNPQFALTDRAGNYRIEGVPPGQWRVVAWHPRARPDLAAKTFAAGNEVRANLTLTANVPLAAHRDKWSGHYDRFTPDGGYHQW